MPTRAAAEQQMVGIVHDSRKRGGLVTGLLAVALTAVTLSVLASWATAGSGPLPDYWLSPV
jgi:hypothetical protein